MCVLAYSPYEISARSYIFNSYSTTITTDITWVMSLPLSSPATKQSWKYSSKNGQKSSSQIKERSHSHDKVSIRTDNVAGFFGRAKQAARKADQGLNFDESVTLSFEDPQRMFSVLSESRRQLMLEIMVEPKTINDLSNRLNRNRSSMTKDIGLLEKVGLIVSSRQSNPGHGIQKMVRAIAPRIEMVAMLG